MKNKFLPVVIVSIALLVFDSCKEEAHRLALYIPKDASSVFTVDIAAIKNKIVSSGITIDSLANLFSEHNSKNDLKWNDIENSGIDLTRTIYIFSKETNSIQQGKTRSGGLIAEVNDAQKLESFLKKQNAAAVSSGGSYKYMLIDDNAVAGWTDEVLIISTVNSTEHMANDDTLSQQQLAALFAQKESGSLASFNGFKDIMAKPGDIHFYTNTSAGLNAAVIPGMSQLNTLLEDSYSEGVINFEKGKIVATGETHYNKTIASMVDKNPPKQIKIDMIKKYPGTLTGFGVISFDPKLLIEILHYLGFDAMADSFASSIGFTTNDVVNAFSGDIAIMFSSRADQATKEFRPNISGFLLNVGIGDRTAFDKVFTGLLNKELLTKKGDTYQLGLAGGHGFVIGTGNNSLLVASSDELIKSYQSSSSNAATLPEGIEKQINNKSMALYIDINKLMQNKPGKDISAGTYGTDTSYTNNVAKAAQETFKNFIASAYKDDGKTFKSNFELNFVNANENSLASLTKFIAIAHKENEKRKVYSKSFRLDSPVIDSMQPENDSDDDE